MVFGFESLGNKPFNVDSVFIRGSIVYDLPAARDLLLWECPKSACIRYSGVGEKQRAGKPWNLEKYKTKKDFEQYVFSIWRRRDVIMP